MINTKKARTIVLILSGILVFICCLGINIMGGFAFLSYENYALCGYALFISSALLIIAFIAAAYKKVIIPIIFNIKKTMCIFIFSLIPEDISEYSHHRFFPMSLPQSFLSFLLPHHNRPPDPLRDPYHFETAAASASDNHKTPAADSHFRALSEDIHSMDICHVVCDV